MRPFGKIIFSVLVLLIPEVLQAQVIINEISWMGALGQPEKEWIELYNPTSQDVDLAGWILKTADNGLVAHLRGTIKSQEHYLLSRKQPTTSTLSDLIYSGTLNNDGEKIILLNESGQIVEEIDNTGGWYAGDNKSKTTMQRRQPDLGSVATSSWCSSADPEGTPKAPNHCATQTTTTAVVSPSAPTTTDITTTAGLWINEILPSPEGPDAENEWIELYNPTGQSVSLDQWQIQDEVGATKKYRFPNEAIIPAKGFYVITRPQSKISLQNDGDSIKLMAPNGQIVDQIKYDQAPLGQSYSRTEQGWFWSAALTPGKNNIIQKPAVSAIIATSNTELTEVEDIAESPKQNIAQINSALPSSPLLWRNLVLGIVVALAVTLIFILLRRRSS